MLRLKSRQTFIPNGFRFYLPEAKWKAPANASFEVISQELLRVIRANPALARRHKWPNDIESVRKWVDSYNAVVCARMGWNDYVITDVAASVPKSSPRLQQLHLSAIAAAAAKAKLLVSGAKTLIDWLGSNGKPVEPEKALERAIVCSKCPHNTQGDFTSWFTVPASELIRRQLAKAREMKLETPRDDQLNICDICYCPLKLKVHAPIDVVMSRLPAETKAKLQQVKDCWVIAESKK